MAYDDLRGLRIQARELDGFAGNEGVAGAVEAVAAHFVLLKVLIGKRVQISLLFHVHAESGIEHSDVGLAGSSCLAGLDAHEVCRIVEGCQVEAVLDGFLHLLVNDDRVAVVGAAVDHAVADGRNFIGAGDDAALLVDQSVHDHLDGFLVGRHGLFELHLILACRRMSQDRTFDSDSLAKALCENALIDHVDELILE